MWKSPRVERVSMTAPQAQSTFDDLYSGWMPSFMTSFQSPLASRGIARWSGRERGI